MKLAPVLAVLLAAPVSAQIRLNHLYTYDLTSTSQSSSGHYIGSHPVAIGWGDVDTIYLAGTNDGTASGVGLARVRVGGSAPVYLNAFGFIAGTPAGFGYTAVDSVIYPVAAYDPGTEHPHGIRAFLNDHSPWWSVSVRGSSGVIQETGPAPQPFGVSWLTYGQDRRAMRDLNGLPLYSIDDGLVVNPGGSAAWRDLAFDYAEGGNYAARRHNDVVHVQRTGPNSGVPSVIVDLPDADLPGQNVEFILFGKPMLVLYNARSSTAPGQSMSDVVRIATEKGAPISIDWNGFTAPTSTGEYDFSYTNDTQLRIAILDVANRRLSVFAAETLPAVFPYCFGDGSGTACPCGNAGASGRGCANTSSAAGALLSTSGVPSRSADTLVLHGSGMANGAALYFQSTDPQANGAGVVFGDGLRCINQNVIRLGVVANVAGASQYPNPGQAPISNSLTLTYVNHYQTWYRNGAPFCTSAGFNLTNALEVWWGP